MWHPLFFLKKGEVQQNHATSIADINGLLTYHKRPQSKSGGQLFASAVGRIKNERRIKKKNVLTIQKCTYYPEVNDTLSILEVSLGKRDHGSFNAIVSPAAVTWRRMVEVRDRVRQTREGSSGRCRGLF
jgi:hypothetical protein